MKQSVKQQRWKKKHYIENKELYLSKQSERRAFIKKYLDDIKMETGCLLCGYHKYPEVLEFHHRKADEKADGVNKAVRDKWGQQRINGEIKKCDVLCANCHRGLHVEERKRSVA